MKESLPGRASGRVREFALYGETTGERDEFGLPIRYDWAADYRGSAMVVYGHPPVPEAEWLNRTICIDTPPCSATRSRRCGIRRVSSCRCRRARCTTSPRSLCIPRRPRRRSARTEMPDVIRRG